MHFPTRRQIHSVPVWRQKNENKMVARNGGECLGQPVFTVPFERVCFFGSGSLSSKSVQRLEMWCLLRMNMDIRVGGISIMDRIILGVDFDSLGHRK